MKTVIVASTNQVKIQAVKDGFVKVFPHEVFEYEGVSVPSGVSDQPMSDEETLRGATERVRAAKEVKPDADFWVGLEGGVSMRGRDMETSAWIVTEDRTGRIGRGRTGSFVLPEAAKELVLKGHELGHADDILFGTHHSKQGLGSVGLFTRGIITRSSLYADAVVLALVPWCHPDLFPLSE